MSCYQLNIGFLEIFTMICKSIVLLSVVACVFGNEGATSEQRVKLNFKSGHYGEVGHIGSNAPERHEKYAWSYPSYEFAYKVNDPHTHDIKGQEESRDGDKVNGEYWLLQADGRKRIVKYHADKDSGFHADVQYVGDSKYEEPKKVAIDYDARPQPDLREYNTHPRSFRQYRRASE